MKYQAIHSDSYRNYHLYNQGNNKQKIFFSESNYVFFRNKISVYLCPYVDILAFCLMPNHFHLLIYTLPQAVELSKAREMQNLSFSIGQLLSSYTKAINRHGSRKGSLFRSQTKNSDGWDDAEPNNSFSSFTELENHENIAINFQFVHNVFEYIHQNPVKAGLVKAPEQWSRKPSGSSSVEYLGLEKQPICNLEKGKKLLGMQ
jgi:putative transposase